MHVERLIRRSILQLSESQFGLVFVVQRQSLALNLSPGTSLNVKAPPIASQWRCASFLIVSSRWRCCGTPHMAFYIAVLVVAATEITKDVEMRSDGAGRRNFVMWPM